MQEGGWFRSQGETHTQTHAGNQSTRARGTVPDRGAARGCCRFAAFYRALEHLVGGGDWALEQRRRRRAAAKRGGGG